MNKKKCQILLDDDSGTAEILIPESLYYVRLVLHDDQRRTLISFLEKWIRWEGIAVRRKDKLEKKISTLYGITAAWKIKSKELWKVDYQSSIHLTFFSQSSSEHQLVLTARELTAAHNHYITHSVDPLYLSKSSVRKLRHSLLDASIKQALKQHRAKRKKEEIYN